MTYQKKDSDGIVAGHARYYEALATEPHHLSRERGTVSNIGGTARLVSDPPNITVASDAELSYVDFPVVLRPIVIITVFVAVLWLILGEPRPSRRISKRPFSR